MKHCVIRVNVMLHPFVSILMHYTLRAVMKDWKKTRGNNRVIMHF